MTALHGLILRTTIAALAVIALTALRPAVAAAQNSEPAATTESGASGPPAAKSAAAAPGLHDGAAADHADGKTDGTAAAATASAAENGAPSSNYISASLKNPDSPI